SGWMRKATAQAARGPWPRPSACTICNENIDASIRRRAMLPRWLLICFVCFATASLMAGTFAIAQKGTARAELGSCTAYSGLASEDSDTAGMTFIRGGTFVMGSERHRPEERFTHIVRVDGFWIDRHEVTNAQFREFVAATGYVTLAERGLDRATHPDMLS